VRQARLLVAAAALAVAAAARASPDGTVIRYGGGDRGKVVFDARVHRKAGLLCADCHASLLPTRRTGLTARSDHGAGTRCFGCHDGKRAFSDCARCHAGA
jgi:c(7)-type cytochrome triheme protein